MDRESPNEGDEGEIEEEDVPLVPEDAFVGSRLQARTKRDVLDHQTVKENTTMGFWAKDSAYPKSFCHTSLGGDLCMLDGAKVELDGCLRLISENPVEGGRGGANEAVVD